MIRLSDCVQGDLENSRFVLRIREQHRKNLHLQYALDKIELRMLDIAIQRIREGLDEMSSSLYLTVSDVLRLPLADRRTVLALSSYERILVPDTPDDLRMHATASLTSSFEQRTMNVQVLQASTERETWSASKDPRCFEDMEEDEFLIRALEFSSPSKNHEEEEFVSVSVLNQVFAREVKKREM